MEEYKESISNIVKKNRKNQNKAKKKTWTPKGPSRRGPIDKFPIDEAKLIIREFTVSDKSCLLRTVKDYHRNFYISIYKKSFRSWFTYAFTGCTIALSVYFLSSTIYGLCLPPILMTVFLVWKVNTYKRSNWCLTVNEMEMLNQTDSNFFKYKSTESRRKNQGVLVALLNEESARDRLEKKMMSNDFDLMDLKESDLENLNSSGDSTSTDNDKDEEVNSAKNKRIVGYLIYTNQKDEIETVTIRDLCIDHDYRQRGIAKALIKKACLNFFRNYGYARVTFNVSNFHKEARLACEKKSCYVHKIYSWTAFNFIFGVSDVRNVYSFNIDQLNKM